MEGNTLPDSQLQGLRARGVLLENEIAYLEGDLLVAQNVLTGEKRLLSATDINESSVKKRLLKG